MIIIIFVIIVIQQYVVKRKSNILLATQKKQITDSIVYAERIQRALFPRKKVLDTFLGEYFIFYKPLHIVSGAFQNTQNLDVFFGNRIRVNKYRKITARNSMK